MRTLPKILALSILLFLLAMPASAIFVWANTTVDSNGAVGEATSLAFNPTTNTPAISYYDFTNKALKYAWYDGMAWVNTTIDDTVNDVADYTSLAFNPGTNTPAISYQSWTPEFNLKYARYDGSVWQITGVDNDGAVGYHNSLAFNDTTNTPAISYTDATNTALKYAWYDGSVWQNITIDSAGTVGSHTSLAFNTSTNTPAISYFDLTNFALKYAWYDGSVWQNTTADTGGTVGQYTSLAFNTSTNTPAISYYDLGSKNLKYAWYKGGVWQNSTVDNSGSVGNFCTSLAFNASTNTPAISYLDSDNGNLKYAWYNGSAWVKDTVDTGEEVGYDSSLAFNAATNTPAISYWDWNPNFNLKYAAYVPAGDISVSSDPAGAWVLLDGVNTTDQTDTLLTGIVPGTHNVTVCREGYVSGINTSVAVPSGGSTSVAFNLTLLPPAANFTVDPAAGYAPLAVQFNDTSSGTVDTWYWDFGDGVTATEQNPSHTFTVGSYTVSLTAGNTTAGNDTVIKTSCITAKMPISDGDDNTLPAGVVKQTGTLLTSSDGKVLQKTTITSDDGIAALTLPLGTTARNGDGEPLKNITIEKVAACAVPPIPDGAAFSFAGFTYLCSPAGATFAPPVTLTFTLSADDWKSLTSEDDFSVRYYNEETEMWEELPVTVDPATHTVTAMVSHFSVFALCLEATDETIPETEPLPVATGSTAPVETDGGDATGTPVPTETQASPIGLAPVAALGALWLLRKRQ